MHKPTIFVALLLGAVAFVCAANGIAPVVPRDLPPGLQELKYDDTVRFKRINYPANGTGWGVIFDPGSTGEDQYYEVCTLKVNLCPPPEESAKKDYAYQEQVKVYDVTPDGRPGNLLWTSDPYDVRVGYWWHTIPVTVPGGLWTRGRLAVFSMAYAGYTCLYQWFDQYDNAPSGTQWFFDGASFAPYTSPACGDIEIRATIGKHDVGVTSITAPVGTIEWNSAFAPVAVVKNYAGFGEADVPVRCYIERVEDGAIVYDQTEFVDFPLDNLTPFNVPFPGATANWDAGACVVHCATALPNEWNPANDAQTANLFVRLTDVECSVIVAPSGSVLQGSVVQPQATVKNNGTQNASFPVTFTIPGSGYTSTRQVTNLAPGVPLNVSFANWTATPPGVLATACQTNLSGDQVSGNNQATGSVTVVAQYHDALADRIVSPTGNVRFGSRVRVIIHVKNNGNVPATFWVKTRLVRPGGTIFRDSAQVTNLAPGETLQVQTVRRRFSRLGVWQLKGWTALVGDEKPANDSVFGSFTVVNQFGWSAMEPLPSGLAVNRGAGIAGNEEDFYVVKGKNAPELYFYGAALEQPEVVGVVPQGDGKIGPGTSIAYSSDQLYVLKGNRSFGFYEFDPDALVWQRLPDLPDGTSERAPKAGAAVSATSALVFVLKGNRTNEFYSFSMATGTWQTLASMPGEALVREGSALCNNGTRIFAFKGGCTEFYTYDIATDIWQRLADLPAKARAGSCLASLGGHVYATCGSGTAFYGYDIATNSWAALDNIPLDPDRKKVAAGASMSTLDGAILLLKGRNSKAVYLYQPDENAFGRAPEVPSIETAISVATRVSMITPNPVSGIARITVPEQAEVRLYAADGRLVRTLAVNGPSVEFNATGIANGVYVLKVFAAGETTTRQLVIQH
jgi:hypothetical protein